MSRKREWMQPLLELETIDNQGNKNRKFWQVGNHAIELFSEKFVTDKINYIHNNPVEAGFVNEPQEWIYSSAKNYVGIEGSLNVEFLISKIYNYLLAC
jgi:hypothetical protein